ncbi:UNVERIFIED_CONTAM: hypothetical protein FKN15_059590 [Acipenser sinensis]
MENIRQAKNETQKKRQPLWSLSKAIQSNYEMQNTEQAKNKKEETASSVCWRISGAPLQSN